MKPYVQIAMWLNHERVGRMQEVNIPVNPQTRIVRGLIKLQNGTQHLIPCNIE